MTRHRKCFNEPIIKIVLDMTRQGVSQKTACMAAGISHQTLQSWLKKGRTATRGEYFNFNRDYEKALVGAREECMENLRSGDVTIEVKSDANGDIVHTRHITTKRASTAWKMLQILEPETYGDKNLVCQTDEKLCEMFLKMTERVYGTEWTAIFQEILDDAKAYKESLVEYDEPFLSQVQ